MTRACRCSTPGGAGPRPGACGAMRLMTDPGRAAHRRRWPTSMPRTAKASTRPRTWPSSRVSCRWTATQASRACWRTARRTGSSSPCWAHCRRRFYELYQSTGSPLAEEALRRIGELYAIEAEIRGRPAEERRTVRQEHSKPIVEALHAWLTIQLGRVSGRSTLAEAIRYALRHWTGLVLFLEDGRLELDTNVIERAIRPIALGRKNALFAGSDGGARHWAIVASLVAIAKLNGVELLAWLTDVLERMVSGRTKAHELERLLPWAWQAEKLEAAVHA
jgi:hypothetical protein